MPVRIPENIAPENYPLALLVDRWVGGGILSYESEKTGKIGPHAYLHEVIIDNRDGGPYLHVNSRIWLVEEDYTVVDNDSAGQELYNTLHKENLWAAHSGFVRVNPVADKREDEATEIEAMLSSGAGISHAWVGLTKGPRIQLVTDGIIRAVSGAQIDSAQLMAAHVDSDLFYSLDMAAFGRGEPMNYLAGRLTRQFDTTTDAPAS